MRTGLIILTFLYLVTFAYGDNIKTLDGKIYYNVQIISKTPVDMTVECTKLPVSENRVLKTLKLSRLDESTQKKYGYGNAKTVQSSHEDNLPVKQKEIQKSKSNSAFDVPPSSSTQQYLIQKTKLSKIQDSINTRTEAQFNEMDDTN